RPKRLAPALGAQAPAVAGFEAGKVELRARSRQIVAHGARELEELGGHLHADDVQPAILRSGAAATVPEEAGLGIVGTVGQRRAQHIAVLAAHRPLTPPSGGRLPGAGPSTPRRR